MTFELWCIQYHEALDARDWQSCDILSEQYPEYADRFANADEPEEAEVTIPDSEPSPGAVSLYRYLEGIMVDPTLDTPKDGDDHD